MTKMIPHPPMMDKARAGFVRSRTFAVPRTSKNMMMIIKEKSVFTEYSKL
jgi:hypothetical protein